MPKTIVWFRQDLRLEDNAPLSAALDLGHDIVPCYIWAPEEEGRWPPGAASKWWLHHSLSALDSSLQERGSRLILLRGPSRGALESLVQETGAQQIFFSRRYEPESLLRDRKLYSYFQQKGIELRSFNSGLLFEPHEIQNQSGAPFRVFTPFWNHVSKKLRAEGLAELNPSPEKILFPKCKVTTLGLKELDLLPHVDWAQQFAASWTPGETGAQSALQVFAAGAVSEYEHARNLPHLRGSSRLSAHLHFGEVGPRQIWKALSARPDRDTGVETFLKEIAWREFAHHLLVHFPDTDRKSLRPEFVNFPWEKSRTLFESWTKGLTGYPIVDAGMRELWATGWMHNRVRMIVASFLVKDLLISWQQGAEWFWDTLVDADLANNSMGWQWSAGCGADAAPFFRIFNPTLQGERFDPRGEYVKKWIPELARVPAGLIHRLWEAEASLLSSCGVKLGKTYPLPIVDHGVARERALRAFDKTKTFR